MFLWDEDAYSALAKTLGDEQVRKSASGEGREHGAASANARAEAEKAYSKVAIDRLRTGIEALDRYPEIATGAPEFVPGNAVELVGHSECGKSQILLHALANAVSIGVRVTFIDTGMRFSPERFRAILQRNVMILNPRDDKEVRELVDLWMLGFNVIRCPGGSVDLIAALSSLLIPPGQEFRKIPLRIIAVDTINEFFWEDISEGAAGEMKQQSVLAAIERLRAPAQRAVLFCTRLLTKTLSPTPAPAPSGKYVYVVDNNTVSYAETLYQFDIGDAGVEFALPQQPAYPQGMPDDDDDLNI